MTAKATTVGKAIGLKEVAAAANVSRMAVSLALRNHPSLPSETRHRIQRIARKIGYRPDPEIAMLMEKVRAKKQHHVQSTIAYLTPSEENSGWHDEPTQQRFFNGAQKRAGECGYRLDKFWLCEPGMTDARLSEIIHHRGINGVIIGPLPKPLQPIFAGFHWEHVSAVALGFSLSAPALHRASNHQFQTMRLLYDKLSALGYRRIGLAIRPDQDNRVNHHWRAGYLASQSLREPPCVIPALMDGEWHCGIFSRWLRQHRPDAIITIGTDVAAWLAELKLETPRDMGLANLDLGPTMANMTGIDQNSSLVGAAAIDLLVSLIMHNERGVPETPRIVMVEARYVAGQSTRPPGSNRG